MREGRGGREGGSERREGEGGSERREGEGGVMNKRIEKSGLRGVD